MKRIYDKQRLERYFKEHNLSELIDEELENHVEIQFFQKEELILKAGEKLNYYYLLVEGKIKVSYLFENGKSMLMKVYSAFNVIGDIEIMKNQPVRCDVEAITDTYLLTIPADLIRKSYMNNVRFLQHLVLSLSTKLEATINNTSYNFIYPLKNRLASYLMEYLREEDLLNEKSEKTAQYRLYLLLPLKKSPSF